MKRLDKIIATEHGEISDISFYESVVRNLLLNSSSHDDNKSSSQLKYLGLHYNSSGKLQVRFYIGAVWLKEHNLALIVNPKIKNLDFLKMLMACYNCGVASEYLAKIYYIEANKPAIPLADNKVEITPFIIIHYLSVLKKITQRGLKHNYVRVSENLSSKIKGKIAFSSHIKKNICQNKQDRVFCNYQDYSTNCIENQILKKAALFARSFIHSYKLKDKNLAQTVDKLLIYFEEMDDNIDIKKIKQFKINPLFKEYAEALKLAKLILDRFDYNLSSCSDKIKSTPPFHIDMPKLFELYVFSLITENKNIPKISYQDNFGSLGTTDFLIPTSDNPENAVIIDTKYKLLYNKDKFELDDIRQVSGYARSYSILKRLGLENCDNFIPHCLIIYPYEEGKNNQELAATDDFKDINTVPDLLKNQLEEFVRISKYSIKLPALTDAKS